MGRYREPDEARVAEIVRAARVVAVVGMKDGRDPTAPAFTVPASMKARGIRIVPVNPTVSSALGETSRGSVGELGERVDVIQVFRRAEAIPALAAEIVALPPSLRPGVVWLQSGIVHAAAAETMQSAGIEVVMDRCFAVDAAKYRA